MGGSVFVDESKRRDYVLVAAAVLPEDATDARKTIKALHLPGQRRLHMVNEKSSRQRLILSRIGELELDVRLYRAGKPSYRTQREARDRCLQQLVEDIAREGHTTLLLERDESILRDDRRVIRHALQRAGRLDSVRYGHGEAGVEPLLAIPDAIAWAWPQGGDWRRRCDSCITKVIEV